MRLTVLAAAGEGFEAPGAEDFWQPLVGDGAFAITRPMVVMVLSVAVIAVVLLSVTRRLEVVPGRSQALTEATYGLVRNSVARDIIGSKNFRPYLPLLFSLFVVILVNNLLGVLPPIQYPTMARIGFPIALSLVVFVVYLYIGFRRKGFLGYIKSLLPAGLPAWIVPLVFFLELLTYFFTRPVTLALRLFGNMFAGHILLLLMVLGGEYMLIEGGPLLKVLSIGPFVMSFVLTLFELLVQFLQAYIFTLLSALYIAGSLADEH
ncbi:MAG: F0F1 ATP synthase subunit A [Actinomycetota bacterium]|nr:F0F1 ATP synthase subunit A [Actinomycetota bacterium]